MKRKVYVAGPMTGIEYFNFPAFDKVGTELHKKGFEIFNPADHDRFLLGKDKKWLPTEEETIGPWKSWNVTEGPSLRTMLGADLNWIAQNATHIYMLKGWERSRGAIAEHALAVALGLEIMYE